jgi:drug/metabolite transporter (DMT)-like permease
MEVIRVSPALVQDGPATIRLRYDSALSDADRQPVIPFSSLMRLVLAAILWGGTFVAGRHLAGVVAPLDAAWWRFLLASVALLAWLRLEQGRWPSLTPRQWVGVGLLGFTGVFAYNLLFFHGLQTVEAGRAALIVAMNPVVIALASSWWFGERLSVSQVIGIGLSLAGALVVIGRGDLSALVQQGIGQGEWLLLGCVFSWVAYTLIGKRLLNRLAPLVAVSYASLAGTVLLTLPLIYRGDLPLTISGGLSSWLGILYLAFFGTVLGFVWYYRGVREIGAARAAQFINLVPVSGVFFGVVLLDEVLSPSLLVGGGLVVLGLLLTNRRPNPSDPDQAGVNHGRQATKT